jgi:hypothetical protein
MRSPTVDIFKINLNLLKQAKLRDYRLERFRRVPHALLKLVASLAQLRNNTDQARNAGSR